MGFVVFKYARFNDDRTHRYWLSRDWSGDGCHSLGFVMYNPSLADGETNDPTITRCIGFAKREGYDGINVCNLHSYVTPYPRNLARDTDPENLKALSSLADYASKTNTPIVCAWGSSIIDKNVDLDFIQMCRNKGVTLKCLGRNRSGSPKHPLYIPVGAPLLDYL
jgi:hypothetical protein